MAKMNKKFKHCTEFSWADECLPYFTWTCPYCKANHYVIQRPNRQIECINGCLKTYHDDFFYIVEEL
ncbi:MAG: hypothetical protein ACW980_24055 [Promethearchaeota archaeon]